MAFEGLIRPPKIELYVGVVKRVSPIWINFEVNGVERLRLLAESPGDVRAHQAISIVRADAQSLEKVRNMVFCIHPVSASRQKQRSGVTLTADAPAFRR
jgi:hypothetical protein